MSDEPEVVETDTDTDEAELAETVAPAAVDEAVAELTLEDDAQSGQEQEDEVAAAEEQALDDEPVAGEAAEEVVAEAEEEALDDEPVADEAGEDVAAEAEEEPLDDAPAADEAAEDVVADAEEEPERQEGRYWYVIHSYSGYENKVKKNLESRIESMGMQDFIFEVVVPTEEVVELRDGRRRTVEQRIFPGYILVDMILNDESWFVVRNTPGVTGFVGSGSQPTPLRQEEADTILRRMEEEAPKVKVSFRIGDAVRIVDGPFSDFMGTVDDLNLEKGTVRLLVSFFGRETPVELDFLQVETQ
jgi:transcriptional antiterminator NusG